MSSGREKQEAREKGKKKKSEDRKKKESDKPITAIGRAARSVSDTARWADKVAGRIAKPVKTAYSKVKEGYSKFSEWRKRSEGVDSLPVEGAESGVPKGSKSSTDAVKSMMKEGASTGGGGVDAAAAKAGAGAGAEGAGAEAAGAAGMGVIGGVAAVGMAFKLAADATIKYTTQQLESASKLKDVSAEMASIFAQKEMMDIQRDQRMGSATSGSTERLMDAEAGRKDASFSIDAQMTNLMNNMLASFNDMLAPFFSGMGEISEWIGKWDNWGSMIWRALTKEDPGTSGGFNSEMNHLNEIVDELERKGGEMMDKAKKGQRMGIDKLWTAPKWKKWINPPE